MIGTSPKVVVVGCAYVDMTIRCSQVPSPGGSVIGSEFSCTATGPGLNQAVQAAMCDCQVQFICKIGGDAFGQMVKDSLADFNVNTDHVYTAQAKNTGTTVTIVNSEGENASIVYAGANSALLPHDIKVAEQAIVDADICLIHGQLPQETIVTALRCAKLHGTEVILNQPRSLEQFAREDSDLPIEYFTADILILNLDEAACLMEHSAANVRTAKLVGSDLVARGAGAVIITMGRRGCMVVDQAGADNISGHEVELVDKTCSGDAFAGALAAYCAVKDDIREATKFASAAGALACTKFGSTESMPTKAEIIELLQKEDIS